MAILIMLNNYFHDLSVAIFFSSVILTWIFIKIFADGAPLKNFKQFIKFSMYLSIISIIFIILLGVPRAIFYREYEWLPAAGRGQINALIIKHIILAILTFSGLLIQWRTYRRFQ